MRLEICYVLPMDGEVPFLLVTTEGRIAQACGIAAYTSCSQLPVGLSDNGALKKYSFTAKIEPGPGGGAFVTFPYDVEKEFGVKGRVPSKSPSKASPIADPWYSAAASNTWSAFSKPSAKQTGRSFAFTLTT